MTNQRHMPLESYSTRWPVLYHREVVQLLTILGDSLLGIEYNGNMAMADSMADQPMIDIIIGLRSLALSKPEFNGLKKLGYHTASPHTLNDQLILHKKGFPAFNLTIVTWGGTLWDNVKKDLT